MQLTVSGRPTWAEVDLGRLRENFRSIKAFCGADILYMAVIKANAYGHGATRCARILEAESADWFGVATMEEGVELRQAGITRPILILGGIWPGQEIHFRNFDLTPLIFTMDQAERVNNDARSASMTTRVHVKIDTGMNRIGFRPEQASEAATRMAELNYIEVEGVMTHFAAADMVSESKFSNQQISIFHSAVDAFLCAGHRPKIIDLANSPAAVAYPHSRAKLVRIGGLLFGVTGDLIPKIIDQPELKPVMSIYSKIAMMKVVPKGESVGYNRTFTAERDSLIATVPIGYNDGYDRSLSNKGEMIVRGTKVPVVGRISMDWTTIDVTEVPEARVGDQVIVLGAEGQRSITAEDIARTVGTISYEVTCGIGPRVPRIYK